VSPATILLSLTLDHEKLLLLERIALATMLQTLCFIEEPSANETPTRYLNAFRQTPFSTSLYQTTGAAPHRMDDTAWKLIGVLLLISLGHFCIRLYQVRMVYRDAAAKHGVVSQDAPDAYRGRISTV